MHWRSHRRAAVPLLLMLMALILFACSSRQEHPAANRSASLEPADPRAPTATVTPTPTSTPSAGDRASGMPRLDHVVIVVMENRDSVQIINNPDAPFINRLAGEGVNLTDMHAETHPSQPNYLALFSGSTQGITRDACPPRFDEPNLASELIAAGYSFTGYSESLPSVGYRGCKAGRYVGKHNPWADFTNVPDASNQPFTAFPTDFNKLPTVSFVIPNLVHDMHDGSIAEGDRWLAEHLGVFVNWATSHRSLLIVTWDENDRRPGNQIPTILVGAGVEPGPNSQPVNHYSLLRSLEDAYGLPTLGRSATAPPIVGVWRPF